MSDAFDRLVAIMDRLRDPGGCPWDREQTHESLRNHLLEEAYEVYDALEAGATPELAGELGEQDVGDAQPSVGAHVAQAVVQPASGRGHEETEAPFGGLP